MVVRAKAEPGKLTLGNEGARTFGGVIVRLFNARTNEQAYLVSYSSVGVGVQDLMDTHIDAMVADLASTAALVKQGRMRVLATTPAKRVPGWEQMPSLSETMLGFDMVGWFAVVAPTGTSPATTACFNKELGALLIDREVSERIATIGPIAEPNVSVKQTVAFLRSEMALRTAITEEIEVLSE